MPIPGLNLPQALLPDDTSAAEWPIIVDMTLAILPTTGHPVEEVLQLDSTVELTPTLNTGPAPALERADECLAVRDLDPGERPRE